MKKVLNLNLTIMWKHWNKKIFCKRLIPNWSEEVFVIKKVKNAVPCKYVISDLNVKK